MSGWFSKAKHALSRPESETPQSFQVACECGQSHSGMRRQRHQRLVCKSCGRALFILPQDVYPPPRGPAPVKPAEKPVDPLVPPSQSVAALRKRTHGKRSAEDFQQSPRVLPELEPVGKTFVLKQADVAQPRPGQLLRENLHQRRPGALWSALRWLGAAAFLIVLITGYWMIRQNQISAAIRIVKEDGEKGLALVEKGEWRAADEMLQPVYRSLNLLKRSDAEAVSLKQYALEVKALTTLCFDPLQQVFDMAGTESVSLNKKSLQRGLFGQVYRGQSVIFEGTVRDVSEAKAAHRTFEFELPPGLANDEASPVILLDSPVLDRLVPKGGEAVAVFAGQIVGVKRDVDRARWILLLHPDSLFLWTHLNTLRAAGFDTISPDQDTSVSQQLSLQAKLVGETQ